MQTGSNRALARALGVSETAVRKAEKAGRIRCAADGNWDVDRVRAAWGANADAAQQRPGHRGLRPVPEAVVGAVQQTLQEQGLPSGGGMTFLQARTANEVLKAQERRLRLQQLKGELVDRARAVSLVFRLARIVGPCSGCASNACAGTRVSRRPPPTGARAASGRSPSGTRRRCSRPAAGSPSLRRPLP